MNKHVFGAAIALGLSAGVASAANIVETAQGAGTFGTLIAAAQAAGLADALANGKNLTVFAPTDEAFAKLPSGTVESLLKPENKAKLTAILTYHVVSGKVLAKDVVGLTSAKTVQGQSAAVKVRPARSSSTAGAPSPWQRRR